MKELSLVHLVRPAGEGANSAEAKPPLLILLHGVGSNERDMFSLARSFDPRFVVVAARSPITLGPDSYGWFRVQFTDRGPVIDADQAKAGWELLARFLDEAVAEYGADSTRVFVGGFSQGGIMSINAMLTIPEKVAAAVDMSGRLLPDVLPFVADAAKLRGKPLLIVHGTADQVLGIEYGRSARAKLEELGLAVSYQEFPIAHTITRESLDVVTSWLTARLDALSATAG